MSARIGWLLAAFALGAAALAAEPVELRALFPNEADVHVDAPGLVRIELPPHVLAACRPDLSNVRLFDPAGAEVPFLLDAPRQGTVRERETIAVAPLQISREEVPRKGRANLRRETYELPGPGKRPRFGTWVLVLEPAARAFVAQVTIRPVPEKNGEVARGSIFRLTSPRSLEKLRVPADLRDAGHLQVVIEHEQPGWLTPSLRYESAASVDVGARATIPLEIRSVRHDEGETVVELARPRGVVPEALRIATSTGTFDRPVTVEDVGTGRAPARVAEGNVFRLAPGTGVEELELALRPALGDRLRLVIEDGDSPSLSDLAVAAVYARPALVAALSSGGAAPAAVLRFGGERARVPRYDLAGLRPQPGREVYGQRAEALIRLYDGATVGIARLGPVRANRAYDPSPALAFAMRPGASLQGGAWEMRRPLHVERAPEGLTRVRLGPDDLAHLAPDLADLRVTDEAGRQWPYLLERDAGSTQVACEVAPARSKGGATTYRLTPAALPVLVDGLRLDPQASFFDRPFRLRAETAEGKSVALAEGRLARPAGDPSPLLLDLPRTRVISLELQVEDGDDAPLVFRAISVRAPTPDLFLVAPSGAYWLLLGAPDARPPRYELERVRDVVLALEADTRAPGAMEKNPDHRAATRLLRGKGGQKTLLWAAIVAAVVVLALLTFRLVRS
ncbi:MAG TPA: hypothetical protein VFV75_20060 [Candidatus Polarisedimenticolaceae bacterium]|nr:hypothetical protein [Candidatus Polarisedimenticolaceae bacterium]